MRKTILALVALSALVLIVGCDPFGSEESIAYIEGTIYVDAGMTVPAEGVTVELLVDPDSCAFISQTVVTNASGNFFMEAQFYPFLPDDETGTGYTMPTSGRAGLAAYYGGSSYIYKAETTGFILSPGDTLRVWDVALSSFSGGGGTQ